MHATTVVTYSTTAGATIATVTPSFGAEATAGGQSMPDIVGNLRIDQARGSAQIMGAAHQVNYGVAADPSDKIGWAFGAGLKVNLPMLGKGDYIIGQFTYGKGAIDYVG